MPLLENLAEGFANAAGATGTVNAIEKNKSHRQALSDEALEDTVQAHMDTMKGIQAKLGQNPSDPELQKALSGERDQLFQLLHPSNNPDALGRVKKLFRHVFRQPEPAQKQPVNNLPSVASMTAGAPTKEDEYAGLTPEQKSKAILIKHGLAPKEGVDKPDPENWQVVTGVIDGKPFTFQHNSKSGESKGLDGKPIPPEQLQGFTVPPKGSSPKVGSFGEFLTEAYGPHPTSQQQLQGRTLWAQANAGTTVGEHVVMVPQVDGTIKPVIVVTTSTKTFPGAGGVSGAGNKPPAKPAGQQKQDLHTMKSKGAGVASVGDAVGGKRTTAQNKADNDVVEATKLSSIADQVSTKPDDAINQKRLAVALERASAGRFTTQALDYIIKAGWGNTIEQWANNPGTGALPKDVMRQLVDGAHQNLKAAKDARAEAFNEPGGGGKTGKKHSLKKAMELRFNKGKSESDVRKDLESHGYEVTP